MAPGHYAVAIGLLTCVTKDRMCVTTKHHEGIGQLGGYWSMTSNGSERKPTTTTKECQTVVCAVILLWTYLKDTILSVRTDHEAQKWLLTMMDISRKSAQWRLLLFKFEFAIVSRTAAKLQAVAALSR